jgi:hypothetical protein
MNIEIPDDWPARRSAEETPLAHLETLAKDAPSGTVPTRWQVAEWSSTREISSPALPGQIRHKTGLSIGSGQALIVRDSNDYPWKQRDVYRLTGSAAELLIAPEGATEIPTGQFRVAEVEGDITTRGVDVDLDERTSLGRDKVAAAVRMGEGSFLVSNSQSIFDPAGLVAELTRQMGYAVGPVAGVDGYLPILDVPFQGSIAPAYPKDIEFGVFLDVSDAPAYVEMDSRIAMTPAGEGSTAVRYDPNGPMPSSILLTMDLQGEATVNFYNEANNNGVLAVDIIKMGNLRRAVVRSRGVNGTFNPETAVAATVPIDQTRPHGIQIELDLTDDGTNYTGVRVRVRTGPGTWSGWSTAPWPNPIGPVGMDFFNYVTPNFKPELSEGVQDRISRFSMVDLNSANTMSADEIWTTNAGPVGRLYLEPLFGTMVSPWLSPDLKVWGALQAIVDAWQGALITDVHGDLHLLNRNTLTGVGIGAERVIDAGLTFEDLPWAMNHADRADRLELKYRPAEGTDTFESWEQVRTVYQAQDVIVLYPGENEVFFSTEYEYVVGAERLQFVRADDPFADEYHSWDAHRYNNGTGGRISPSGLSFSLRQVTTATWVVTIVNSTGQPCHLVDSTGQPSLTIRTLFYYFQPFVVTVERGLPATQARHSLTIDADNYIQTEADAEMIADFIWSRVNTRSWRADRVNVVPDYRLDLGDVVEVVHARTQMKSNALVTRVHLDGVPGRVGQQVDLVLIPPTWEDADEAWAAAGWTWDDFDALWSSHDWQTFDRVPTATTEAEIQEAL